MPLDDASPPVVVAEGVLDDLMITAAPEPVSAGSPLAVLAEPPEETPASAPLPVVDAEFPAPEPPVIMLAPEGVELCLRPGVKMIT